MARTALSVQRPSADGVALVYANANVDGHSFSASNAFVHVKNGSGGTVTLTLPTPGTVEGLAVADRTIAIPAGQDKAFVPTDAVKDAAGSMNIDFSSVTSVTIAAIGI